MNLYRSCPSRARGSLVAISAAALLAIPVFTGCNQQSDIVVSSPTTSDATAGGSSSTGSSGGGASTGGTAVTETFNPWTSTITTQMVEPPLNVLIVMDNSGSTAGYQANFQQGFTQFAGAYFNANSQIRLATITTDTYLANNTSASGYGPNEAQCYDRLVPGVHDGSLPSVADGIMAPFVTGTCQLTATALSTLQNAGNRSLQPILSTVPADGSTPNAAYFAALTANFELNALPGSNGNGSERGFQSLNSFLTDNEEQPACETSPATDPSCFFPHYSLTGNQDPPINAVVVVSDEHSHDAWSYGGTTINHTESVLIKMTDAQVLSSSQTLIQAVKPRLDAFFNSLHESTVNNPNYFFSSVINNPCNAGAPDYTACGMTEDGNTERDQNEEWGPEYGIMSGALSGNDGSNGLPVQTADTVNTSAKYSEIYNINDTTGYSSLFASIGSVLTSNTQITEIYTFTLSQGVGNVAALTLTIVLGDGTPIPVPTAQFSVSGVTLTVNSAYLQTEIGADHAARLQVVIQ